MLSGNEQVYCSQCKTHTNQLKRLSIFRFPHVLVLHIKRFSSTGLTPMHSARYSYLLGGGGGGTSKLYTDVQFPLTLDLSAYRPPSSADTAPLTYHLFAVSNHIGSMAGGHYTAHCKVKPANSVRVAGLPLMPRQIAYVWLALCVCVHL